MWSMGPSRPRHQQGAALIGWTTTPSPSLAEGRLPETFGGWSEGRLPRAGLVTLHSGDPGLRLGDTTVPPAESRLIRPAHAVLESAARAEKSRGGAPNGA